MGNLNILLLFTVLGAAFWPTLKSSSEQSNEDTNTCLRLRDEVTEIREMLKKLVSEIDGIKEDIQKSCAGDPPSLRNGKVTDFGRSPGSRVRYVCERNFVMTGNSTVRCESGKWEGHPPACSYFDATFYAELNRKAPSLYIECYSDFNAGKIGFSRVVDTGKGGELPRGVELTTSEKSARMYLKGVREWRAWLGAYRCGFEAEEGSAHAVVPFQAGVVFYFPDPSEVASVGDNVTLQLYSFDPSVPVFWSHDGRSVPSWTGMSAVIRHMNAGSSGIYSARYGYETSDYAIGHLSVRSCKANMFGERCDQVCPPCYNGGICHDLLGICVCREGFVGRNCETPCPEGFHGADCSTACGDGNCEGRLFCKPDPYGCFCARGFKGASCNVDCEPGWYGAHCKHPCHCAEDGDCNRFTGECSGGCAHGWKGISCQIRDDE